MGDAILRRFAAGLMASVVVSAPAMAQEIDAELVFNQKFQGIISEQTDADLIAFEESQGSKLTIVATRKTASVSPKVELLDASKTPLDISGFYTQSGSKGVLKKFPAPYSGTYYARISAANGLTGTYQATIKGSPASDFEPAALFSKNR